MNNLCKPYYKAMNSGAPNPEFDFFKPAIGAKPPTILQVLPALNSGGVERGTLEISDALVAAGWKSIVVSRGGSMVKALKHNGGLHITLAVGSKNPMNWVNCYNQLKHIISEHDVKLVHARSRMPAWLSFIAARSKGIPFITTFHGRYKDSNFLKKLYNSIMIRGEKTIAISRYIAAEIIARHSLDPQQLYIIPRGVDLTFFDKSSISPERVNKLLDDWNIPNNVPIIMLPGRITRWKGHELLIESLAKINDLPFFCIIVGPYDEKKTYKKSLETLVHRNYISSKIKFVGDCSDMAAAYKISDIVISASLDPEPFGRVIIEGQAMGNIVLASNHGGAIESIVDQKTGWLFNPCDSASLAKALRRILNLSKNETSKMADASIAHIRKNFSKKDMCMRTLSLYSETLGFSPTRNKD